MKIALTKTGMIRFPLGLRLLLAAASALFALNSRAQVPVPVNFCGSMNPDGTFALTWETPPGADPDLNYELYRDDGTGFALLNMQAPATNTGFTDFGLDPNQVNGYYVRSVFQGDFSENSEIIFNMVLSLDALSQSVAVLNWTAPYDDPMPPGQYEVYRTLPGEAPELRGVLNETTFTDTLQGICDDAVVTYYVEFAGANCTTRSQTAEEEFLDIIPPPQPVIETAVTDPESGDIIVYWDPVSAPDLDLYRIQDIDLLNQQFINIGVVQAGEPTEFIYEGAGANEEKTLAVIAFDLCGNDASFSGTATTMFAEAEYSECATDAMVSWTPYAGWPEGVDAYLIKAFIDGGAEELMGEVTGDETFFIAEVDPNREYCFFVEALSAGDQRNSTSNAACVTTDYPVIADFLYNSYVTVIDNTTAEVALLQDPESEGMTYELFRARQTGGFVKLGTFGQTGQEFLIYTDTDLDTRNLNYRYKWRAYDGCGVFIGESNVGRTMTLTTLADTRELANVLTWTAYEEWENGVGRYRIERRVGREGPFEDYAETDGETTVFTDNVEEFRFEEGEFCYRIVAEEAANSYGVSSESATVERCITQPPVMWIPSAIMLDGEPENRVFKPVAAFIDFDSFRMEIYNKWGQRLFTSDDTEEGWDGTFRGGFVPPDMYRYIISYNDGSGKPFVEQDVIYVLKHN